MPATCATTPVLRNAVQGFRKAFGLKLDTMKIVEDITLKKGVHIPLWSKLGAGMFEAAKRARVWRGDRSTRIAKATSKFSAGESENILMAIIDPVAATKFHGTTPAQFARAKELEEIMLETIMSSGGLNKAQATRFLKQDLVKLRQAQGDMSRVNVNNIYPETFQPFFDELANGGINATRNDAHGLAWDLVNAGEKVRFLTPAANAARAEMKSWAKIPGINRADLATATELADDYVKGHFQQHETTAGIAADLINKVGGSVSKALGGKGLNIDDGTLNQWAMHMAGWYGGVAMSFRPALAARNMTQILLPATIVGFKHLGPALRDVYGKNRQKHVGTAFKDLGISLESADVFLGENLGQNAPIKNPILRLAKRVQELGLKPYRWTDVKHNRVVTYRMGQLSMEEAAPKLLSGKITWDQFTVKTGIAGRPQVDQNLIKSLLMGTEHPNIEQAGREWGKRLVESTQFIYDGANSPAAFQGTVGRLFGQFGVWPVSFAELMISNLSSRNAGYTQKFLGNYAVQKAALAGVGIAAGVDTSTWNFANPLTFQGGPWYQGVRDVATLGTSANEFELREAKNNLNRWMGRGGTPFTGVANPIGGATTDWIQSAAADDPLEAMMLLLGFNSRSNVTATKR